MFIDVLTPVRVVSARLIGRIGVVSKIRLLNGFTMVHVDLYNPETGGHDEHIFEPHELKRRLLRPIQEEQAILASMDAELERLAA